MEKTINKRIVIEDVLITYRSDLQYVDGNKCYIKGTLYKFEEAEAYSFIIKDELAEILAVTPYEGQWFKEVLGIQTPGGVIIIDDLTTFKEEKNTELVKNLLKYTINRPDSINENNN